MKFECHGHIMADGKSYYDAAALHKNAPDLRHIHAAFQAMIANEIGYFRDGGDRFGVSEAAMAIAPQYNIDYVTPCFIIHREGYYGALYGRGYSDMKQARELISHAKSLGADFIKTTASGMLDFNGDGGVMGSAVEQQELREIVKIAGDAGLRVMIHCNGAENIKNALLAGVLSIEHGFWADDECIELFCETGAFWVPTCAPVKNAIGCGRFNDDALCRILEHHEKVLKTAHKKGVKIASGSDCGAFMVPHGAGTIDEYAVLSRLGIDPQRANEELAASFRKQA